MRDLLSKADLDTVEGEQAREILDSVSNGLKEHNLSYKQFSVFYLAEYTEAGSRGKTARRLKKTVNQKINTREEAIGKLGRKTTEEAER